MSKSPKKPSPIRRQVANISQVGTTQLHLRNPLVIAWWSAAFPGLGHLLLSKYLRGFLLFIWEVVINYQSNINLAIIYSFTGRFKMAKEIINKEWMLLYVPLYLFTIWDGYRTTVDINHQYLLAAREDAPLKNFTIKPLEINYLDKREPWVAAIWSFLMPGSGQLYINRIITAAFILISWILTIYISKVLPAIHLTLIGNFDGAKAVLDPRWFLNLPSIWLFAVYDAYVNTVENNKLFDWEQARYFALEYRNPSFCMPFKEKSDDKGMYVVSTFEHSTYLELAMMEVESRGVAKENIIATAMDKRLEERKLFDSTHYSDGLSLIDLALVLGCVFMVLGAIYGFVLEWGPIIWGLIGLFFGTSLGLIIKMVTTKKDFYRQKSKISTEVVLIIACKEGQVNMVKDTLWAHHALGVSQLELINQ